MFALRHLRAPCIVGLAMCETACLTLAIREGGVRSLVHDEPVRLADVTESRSPVVSPYLEVSVDPEFTVTDYLHHDNLLTGSQSERMTWTTPAIGVGTSFELPLNRYLSVGGTGSVGRAGGASVWMGSGNLGLTLPLELVAMPDGAGLRFDLGLRAKRNNVDITYAETYTEGDSTYNASGRFAGSDVTVDGYFSATFNPAQLAGYSPFVNLEAAIVPFMDFDLESQLTDRDHHRVRRLAGSFSVAGGVVRQIDDRNRLLSGLRFGYIGGAPGVWFFLQLDHRMPTGE